MLSELEDLQKRYKQFEGFSTTNPAVFNAMFGAIYEILEILIKKEKQNEIH